MAYKRRGRRRERHNTTWQPWAAYQAYSDVDATPKSKLFGLLEPSIETTKPDGSVDYDYFDNQHMLERIRGICVHQGPSSGNDELVFVNIAAAKVPRLIATKLADADMPNLFHSGDGEDFPFFMSCSCGQIGPDRNWNEVDVKSKRKFDPGDALIFSVTYYSPTAPVTRPLHISLNLRLLWRLFAT